jgi:hypothetical protein
MRSKPTLAVDTTKSVKNESEYELNVSPRAYSPSCVLGPLHSSSSLFSNFRRAPLLAAEREQTGVSATIIDCAVSAIATVKPFNAASYETARATQSFVNRLKSSTHHLHKITPSPRDKNQVPSTKKANNNHSASPAPSKKSILSSPPRPSDMATYVPYSSKECGTGKR